MSGTRIDAGIAAHNLRILAELRIVIGALHEANIEAVVLKGVPLMQRIGERLDHRRLADNDVLVHRADVRRAMEALQRLGYHSGWGRSIVTDLEGGFEHALVRPDGDGGWTTCELHWNAFAPAIADVPEALPWEHVTTFESDSRLKVFEPRIQLLHLVAHALQHELCEARTLITFGLAWDRWHDVADHEELGHMARQFGLFHALSFLFGVARDLGFTTAAIPQLPSRPAGAARRLLPVARLREDAVHVYPERYRRIGVTTLLLPLATALRYCAARAFPRRERGPAGNPEWAHWVQYSALRAFRPALRSLGWRPVSDGSDLGSSTRRSLARSVGATLEYVKVHRSLEVRYRTRSLNDLVSDLGTALAVRPALSLGELAMAIDLAERLIPRISSTPNTCLYRALSRFALVSAHGYTPTFVLGVSSRKGEAGHAWIEVSGEPFLEPGRPVFTRVYAAKAP